MDPKLYKQALLNELYEPYKNCTMCPLGSLGRKNVVFGEGDPDAGLMFIGEGPGRDEDLQGRPFVGRSGQLLTRTLASHQVKRENVFISNIVKCRPPDNRTPTELESTTCKKLLLEKQIKIIRPKVICTLGSTALVHLTGKEFKITKARGKIIEQNGMIIIPTYHPAYILRNASEITTFSNDIKFALEQAQLLQKK
ncbi:MAG: Uracil DNA glycosylase superfamily protein [Candidatus Dependentiae bacterium ADurb.Bin331]|nr:MAG: Uracil DNA glycosylase superfamily protein [Candidatus Dependentiae bacterium ADurb.Bin331]